LKQKESKLARGGKKDLKQNKTKCSKVWLSGIAYGFFIFLRLILSKAVLRSKCKKREKKDRVREIGVNRLRIANLKAEMHAGQKGG